MHSERDQVRERGRAREKWARNCNIKCYAIKVFLVGASERPQETGRSTNERHSLWLTCTTRRWPPSTNNNNNNSDCAEIADCVIGKTLEAVVLVAPDCGIKTRAAFELQTLPLQPCSQRGLLPSKPRTTSRLSLKPSQMANNIKVSPVSGKSEEPSGKCFLLWTIIVNLLVLIKNALVKEALGRSRAFSSTLHQKSFLFLCPVNIGKANGVY